MHSEILRDKALGEAKELRLKGKLSEAREAAQASGRHDREAQKFLIAEKVADAEKRRDYLAELGYELSEAGDKPGARKSPKRLSTGVREIEKRRGSS